VNLIDGLKIGIRGLASHRMRTALTALGVIIGVGAVVALVSIGQGSQSAISAEIESMGTNLIFVSPGRTEERGVMGARGSARTLTWQDSIEIAELPYVSRAVPQAVALAQVGAGGENVNTRLRGVTPEYLSVHNFQLAEGEFISPRDVRSRLMVCILGSYVADTLFGAADPVGEKVKAAKSHLRVIGVLESKGGGENSGDDQILVPISTLRSRLDPQRTPRGEDIVQVISVQANDPSHFDLIEEEITQLLRERHRLVETEEDDFDITTLEDILEMFGNIMGIFTMLLGSIGGISLIVSGIGIMNIMLVSVTERTREIGIRKAVGAKRRDILLQFLIEAMVLCLAGGVIGLFLGWGISYLGLHIVVPLMGMTKATIPATIPPSVAILALVITSVVGLGSGVYPAFRAARLHPVDALHYE
jgi:putative ABC transport system permease protein